MPLDELLAWPMVTSPESTMTMFVNILQWVLPNLLTLGSTCRSAFTESLANLLDSDDVPARVKLSWNDIIGRLVT